MNDNLKTGGVLLGMLGYPDQKVGFHLLEDRSSRLLTPPTTPG